MWQLKVFVVFPLLARMRNLDHYARWMLPAAYLLYILYHAAEVDFGRMDYGSPRSSFCDSHHDV